jgi:hypothetical protein
MKSNRNLLGDAVRLGFVAGAVGLAGLQAEPVRAQDAAQAKETTEINNAVSIPAALLEQLRNLVAKANDGTISTAPPGPAPRPVNPNLDNRTDD